MSPAARRSASGSGSGSADLLDRPDLADVALERAQLGREAPGVLAQALHQAAELVVQRADPLEQLARRGRDPVHVLARLLAGLGAQLLGRRLGRLDDPLDLRGRRGRDGLGARAAHALELVGELAQVRVDRARLVAAADGREVRALDGGAVEGHAVMLRCVTSRKTAWATKCATP